MNILRLEHVNKSYGEKENKIIALNDVSLEIEQGTFVTIVGKSGSGKSTLLNLMGGLDTMDSGQIYLGDIAYSQLSEKQMTLLRRRKIGFVFQFFNLIPSLNVYENIVFPIHLDGLKEDEKYINDIIHTLGLESKRNNYIDELSGGQQQRVAIARALASQPSIILLDEPTGNLDSKNGNDVIQLLHYSQKTYQQTIVMVTHDAMMANQSNRIITLDDGKIIGDSHV
ncbi:MAG: ABC transporter ATP-binding protein [Longibaculum sp.]